MKLADQAAIWFFVVIITCCSMTYFLRLIESNATKGMHTTAELEDAIQTAYNLGVSECPMNKHCMALDIQLKRLTMEDVEGLIE